MKPIDKEIIIWAINYIYTTNQFPSIQEMMALNLPEYLNNSLMASLAVLGSDHNVIDYIANCSDSLSLAASDPEIIPNLNPSIITKLSQACEKSTKLMRQANILRRKNFIVAWKFKDGSILEINENIMEPAGIWKTENEWRLDT